MLLASTLAVMLGLGAQVTATTKNDSKGCDFSGIDVDPFMTRILALLPSNYSIKPADFRPFIPGLEIGSLRLSGFDKILRYGPLVPYCVDGRHMVQVDLINNGDVSMISRWKSCSGREGDIRFRNSFSRFTVQFHVLTHPTVRAFSFDFEDAVVPVSSGYPYLVIEGAGEGVSTASRWLSKIFPAEVTKVWTDNFRTHFASALREAVRAIFSGGPRPVLYYERLH
nr:uncharacterized protein LOC126534936 [Dermacentor andersoni]